MNKISTFLLLTLICSNSFGQKLQNGLILPENSGDNGLCCVYVPTEGFNIYGKPNGSKIGLLTRNVESNTGNESSYHVYLDQNNGEPIQLSLDDFKEIGYEEWTVSYFERANGFLRILNDQVSYWISEKDVTDKHFKIQEWPEFLFDNAGLLLGFYANEPGLNLRTSASTNGNILKTLKGDLFEITPTAERDGLWMKVKVKKYKEHICESSLSEDEILVYELTGWIKVVDDSGLPNLWYYSRGC